VAVGRTIADNKLAENTEWDDRLPAQQLKDRSLIHLDLSLGLTGFEMFAPLVSRMAGSEWDPTLARAPFSR
jgi:hypothetical protein